MRKSAIVIILIILIPIKAMSDLDIVPKLRINETFDDNIYLEKENIISSYILDLNPSCKVYFRNRENILSIYWGGNYIFYSEDPDTNNDQQNHLKILGVAKFGRGLSFSIYDKYYDTSDPAQSELTERADRIENISNGRITYEISPKTSIDASFNFVIHEYDSEDYENFNRHIISRHGIFKYRAFPKTSLLLRYTNGNIAYDTAADKDLIYNQIETGITGELTQKINTVLRGGYQLRDYKTEAMEDFEAPVVTLDLNYQASTKTKLNLQGGYAIKESIYKTNNHYKS
ncbi:MAG: hypothetical protein ACOC5R_04140, partial [Elusimicrobiota bacterium]